MMKSNQKRAARTVTVLLMVVVMVFMLAACGSSGNNAGSDGPAGGDASAPPASGGDTSASGEPQYGGEAKIIYNSFVDTRVQLGLPWMITGALDATAAPMMEPLMLETKTGELQPYLATEWLEEPENNRVIFTIREGVKFHDGSEMTPEVVAWNINQWLASGQADANYLNAEVNDEGKVVVNLEQYQNTWVFMFCWRKFSIISKEAYDKYGPDEINNHPTGTGPFLFDKVVPGQSIRYVRNDNYWQEGMPYLDSLVYTEIADNNTRDMAFQAGTGTERTDVLYLSTAQQVAEYVAMGDKVKLVINDGGTVLLSPDSNHPASPLADYRVREACSLAIDRDTLCEARGFGLYTPAYQLFPDFAADVHLSDDDPAILEPYNPEKAKELLAEAGYPDGIDITIYATTDAPGVDKDLMEAIAAMLTESNIRTKTVYMPNPEWIALANGDEGWTDGFGVSGMYTNGWAMNNYGYGDLSPYWRGGATVWRPVDEILPLFDAQMATNVIDRDLTQGIHRIALENLVNMPVYHIYTYTATKPYVHGGFFGGEDEVGGYDTASCWLPETLWLEQDKIDY